VNDQLPQEESPRKPNVVQTLAVAAAAIGAAIAVHQFVFGYDVPCYSSPYAYTALHFAVLSVGFSVMFALMSFIPAAMKQVEDFYPDPEGRGEWHARQAYRLTAVSNLGHALLLLACGWMFPYENEDVWRHFTVVFSIGFVIVFTCKFLGWLRHKPYRRIIVEAHALAWALMAILFAALLLNWAHSFSFFDPVAVVLIYTVSGVVAGLVIGMREQLKRAESKAKTGEGG
jgi:magnesium-transporting ATPase (P-type)